MTCLAPERVLDYVTQRLGASEREEVERHVDTCSACRELIAEVARSGIDELATEPSDAPRQLGRYQILSQHGEGGMGIVYDAHDPQLDRRVALKVVHADLVGRGGLERLVREGRALAKLSHPNIVAVHDAGSDDNRAYIAMQLVEGDTLAAWLAAAPRTWREIATMFVGVARGLAAAHGAGIIHRDVKPQNVLVARDGTPKVVDFGLARYEQSATEPAPGEPPTRLTRPGMLLGTPAFMSPEQRRGEDVSPATDQFSLCEAAIRALDGKRSPRWLTRALERGRAEDPAERFPSMDALAGAIDPERHARRMRTIAIAATAPVVVAAVALAAFRGPKTDSLDTACAAAASARRALWIGPARDRVKHAFDASSVPYAAETWAPFDGSIEKLLAQHAAAEAQLCEQHPRSAAARETVAYGFACLAEQRRELVDVVQRLESPTPKELLSAVALVHALPDPAECANLEMLAAERTTTATPDAIATAELVRSTIAAAREAPPAGQYALAARLANRAVELAKPLGGALLARAHLAAGDVSNGQFDKIEAEYRAAETAAESAHADDLRALALVQLIGAIARQQGRETEALSLTSIAESAIARAREHDALEAALRRSIGIAHERLGHNDQALAAFTAALEVARKALPPNDPRIPGYVSALAVAIGNSGRAEDAVKLDEEALRIASDVYGANHPEAVRFTINLAARHAALGNCELALTELTHARERLADFAPTSEELLKIPQTMGACYYVLDRLDDAMREYRARQQALQSAGKEERAELALSYVDIGDVEDRRNHLDAALRAYQRAVDDLELVVGKTDVRLAVPLTHVAQTWLRMEKQASAIVPLERALSILEATDSPPNEQADTKFMLAIALWETHGDRTRAMRLAKEARDAYANAGAMYTESLAQIDDWLRLAR